MDRNINLLQEEPQQTLAMHPKKFALWLFIVSIVMIFAAMSSAYMVRQAEGNWLDFEMPTIFWVNSGILLASSVTMQWAYMAAKRDNLAMLKVAMIITTFLGLGFLVGQWYSWVALVDMKVFFAGTASNPSGSFLYVITGLHAFHLVTGIVYLVIILGASFQYKIHSKNLVRMEMCATYWHFLDILWIYLFAFLLLNH
ncbi:cytochrome c oxidase subunit 3 [Rhodocytophaga aerolata]|uniref:Cytochrome c oxidase subunit 3 n=1 Tax=Rhodocytophaga aerolata TaxID=455078 RepID=A0ABT8R874_9BACT|nr:cytochrome c oxidase subunit 3 [Rhodocytophaga aerolata]MDO1447549.1 cytochrome c oxidase subunit 3 [Rhodocytophaga aerolata]